jgi:hypothetical protein
MRRMEKRSHSSTILNICSRWRWVAIFTFLPLYYRRNNAWCGFPPRMAVLGIMNKGEFSCPTRNRTLIPRWSNPKTVYSNDWAISSARGTDISYSLFLYILVFLLTFSCFVVISRVVPCRENLLIVFSSSWFLTKELAKPRNLVSRNLIMSQFHQFVSVSAVRCNYGIRGHKINWALCEMTCTW